MMSLASFPINAASIAARPLVGAATPLMAAAATGYFLTDINHQYFEFLRKNVQSENEGILSSMGNFSKKGGLYLLETAAPIVAFVALPLDPIGIAVRVGMVTRGVLAASNKTILGLCMEAIKQLLNKLYTICFGKVELKGPFPEMFKENTFEEITSKSGPVEEITIKETTLLKAIEEKSVAITYVPAEKDPITGLSKEETKEFDYLDVYSTDSFSTKQVAKMSPYAAYRLMNKEMTSKAEVSTQDVQEEETVHEQEDDIDGGSVEVPVEKEAFKGPVRQKEPRFEMIDWKKMPQMQLLSSKPQSFKSNSVQQTSFRGKTTKMSQMPAKAPSRNVAKTVVKVLKFVKI